MKRFLMLTAAVLAVALPAQALMMAPSPIAQRVANSQAVILGKVTAIEEKPILATQFPGAKEKVEYHLAVVKVDEAITGVKGLTHVKVGFIVPKPAPEPQPGQPRLSSGRRFPSVQLAVGQEVCLFLNSHHDGGFEIAQNYFDMIDKKSPNFANEVAEAKKAAKLLADPKAGLKSKDVDERLLTASMLLSRYRMQRTADAKTEAVDAEESKLILGALADADWTKQPRQPGAYMAMPQNMFNMLGVGPQDGWQAPRDIKEFQVAAKRWLMDNKETYRIKRFVK